MGLRIIVGGDQHRGRAVHDAAGVAGVMHMVDFPGMGIDPQRHLVEGLAVVVGRVGAQLHERSVEGGQPFGGGLGAWKFIAIQHDLAGDILHRQHGVVETPRGHGLARFSLAVQGEGVHGFAAEALQGGDQIRRNALRHKGMQGEQAGTVSIQPGAVRTHRLARHGLHAAPHGQLLLAGKHTHQGEIDPLQARTAEPVEGHRAHLVRPLGQQHRVACDAGPLLAHLGHAAHHHILHVLDLDRIALRQRPQAGGEKFLGVGFGQAAARFFRGAFLALAPGRAHCVDDPGFSHDLLSNDGWGRNGCSMNCAMNAPGGRQPSPVHPKREHRNNEFLHNPMIWAGIQWSGNGQIAESSPVYLPLSFPPRDAGGQNFPQQFPGDRISTDISPAL